MAKRFTDTEKWKDPWFRKLSAEAKVLFNYFCDDCDLAGFLQQDDDAFCFLTGIPKEKIEGLYQELSKSVAVKDGWIWVKNFLRHQKNLPLNPQNNAHKHIIGILNIQVTRFGFGILEEKIGALKGLLSPLGIGNGKDKVKEGIVKGGFDRFWETYPKKRSKGQAERVWAKLKPDEMLQDRILKAIERSKTSADWLKDGGQFIPYPATWLNAKGWEDSHSTNITLPQKAKWTPPKEPEIRISDEERRSLIEKDLPGYARRSV